MVGQQPVFLSARVRDDIGYGLEVTEQELGAVCERVGLPAALLNRPSSELSVGQAQRASIARALVRQPAVLLLDEPTAPLDRDSAMTIEAALQDMMARGATVILVTHDLEQARRLASQAVLLADGRMRASGDVQTVTSAWDPILWS
jgi:ABC-type multidrug transport system ATPase subunit